MESINEFARFVLSDSDRLGLVVAELETLARAVSGDLVALWVVTDDTLLAIASVGARADSVGRGRSIPLTTCRLLVDALHAAAPRSVGPASVEPGENMALFGDPEGEWTAIVAPLVVSRRPLGVAVLTRPSLGPFDPLAIALVGGHARILTLLFENEARRAELEELCRSGEERISLLENELLGEAGASLGESVSPAMQEVVWRARQVAPTDAPVLILGETGVGKERVAHAIHEWSGRAARPFVQLNCAAIAAGILESELFGHTKGAFTGATRDRPGRFQIADRGTLLLDEIGELQLELQAKLLRVLQDGTFFPVGSDHPVRVDVRILAATHVDLELATTEQRFRSDLYYRLSVFPLRLPPLRERIDDLPRLCDALLGSHASRSTGRRARLSPAALAKLSGYDWPGNLRELANVLERATILSRDSELGPEVIDLPERGAPPAAAPAPALSPEYPQLANTTLAEAQRCHIQRVLKVTGGRIYGPGGAAELLDVKPSTLQSRMKKLGIKRSPNGTSPSRDDDGGAGSTASHANT